MKSICLYCAKLAGCPLLQDQKGFFVPERVLTEDSSIDCPSWAICSKAQEDVRTTMFGISGESALRVMHQMPAMIINQLVEKEEMDGMEDVDIDLTSLLYEGITSTERELQLRYVTDENGVVIEEEEGFKRPRPSHQLRKYLCDPEGHIRVDHSAGMFWTNEVAIKHILRTEIEQGLVEKVKKSNPKQASAEKTRETKPSVEKPKMATGKRVLINRGKKSSGASTSPKKSAGKVASPPRRGGAKVSTKKEAPAIEDSSGDAGTDLQEIKQLLFNQNEEIQGLRDELKAFKGELKEFVATKINESSSLIEVHGLRNLEGTTVLHDLLIQTQGTMQYYEEGEEESQPLDYMLTNPDLILGHFSEQEGEE